MKQLLMTIILSICVLLSIGLWFMWIIYGNKEYFFVGMTVTCLSSIVILKYKPYRII